MKNAKVGNVELRSPTMISKSRRPYTTGTDRQTDRT